MVYLTFYVALTGFLEEKLETFWDAADTSPPSDSKRRKKLIGAWIWVMFLDLNPLT